MPAIRFRQKPRAWGISILHHDVKSNIRVFCSYFPFHVLIYIYFPNTWENVTFPVCLFYGKICLYSGYPGIQKYKADQKQSEMGTRPIKLASNSLSSFHIKRQKSRWKFDHVRVNSQRDRVSGLRDGKSKKYKHVLIPSIQINHEGPCRW